MQCKCGGETTDHKVTRFKVTAGEYAKCNSCGRIAWKYMCPELKEELEQEKIISNQCLQSCNY